MSDCPYFVPINDCVDCCYTEDLRFLNTDNTQNERELFSQWFKEEIEKYGIEVDYMVQNYQLSAHNALYGEHVMSKFSDPQTVLMYVIFNSDSIVLNQFGIESDADVTAFIHISAYKETFGIDNEPKAGDLIQLTEYGNTNRPGGRNGAIFEITRRDDEDLTLINPLMGHYLWLIRAKRYDYSFERNVIPENKLNQINDDVSISSLQLTGTAGLSAVTSRIEKIYPDNMDALGKQIFDYDANPESNDSIYGDY